MSNPLQPKVIKCIEEEFHGVAINLVAASKSGFMDIVACIEGEFWGFEVKWKSDTPSQLQRQKINAITAAKGRAYFIRSVDQLRKTITERLPSEHYDLRSGIVL